ncbi:MAG: Brp/Blh family beta-carotene 15,15'-dioxygenase [Acidobacteriota bacterium]
MIASISQSASIPRWWVVHCRVAAGLTSLGLLAMWIVSPTRSQQILLLSVGVACLGVPHGALDHLLGRRLLRPRLGPLWIPTFLILYLGLSAIVIAVWVVHPTIALAAFLGLSVVHFGLGDARRELSTGALYPLEVLTRGSLPVLLPMFFHSAEVAGLFGWLVGSEAAPSGAEISAAARLGVALLAPAAVWTVGHHLVGLIQARRKGHGDILVELFAIVAVGVFAPPLVSFLVYFCLWHSLRHTLDTASSLDPSGLRRALLRFAAMATPLTVITLLLASGAWAFLRASGSAVAPAVVQVLFIGLAALTVPHMMLCAMVNLDAGPSEISLARPVTREASEG